MRILISGGTGFIGAALRQDLESHGHEVVPLVRKRDLPGIFWDPDNGILGQGAPAEPKEQLEKLEGFDAAIHLSGENVAAKRWSETQKQKILTSRVKSTELLFEALRKLTRPPAVCISASAAGYYGADVREPVDEEAPRGPGFLADVCVAWERAATTTPKVASGPAASTSSGPRVVLTRFGVVLAPGGGMLGKILPVFKFGLGAQLADGKHWISWISRRDAVSAIKYCLENTTIRGPVNIVSPQPVTNHEFTKDLGKALHRPTLGSVPRPVLKLMFGEMAGETALASQRVLPGKLLKAGFQFQDTDLSRYLNEVLS